MLSRSIGAAALWCLAPVSFAGALHAAQEVQAQRSATLHFGDVDGDGLDDALVVGAQGEVSLLANRGEGRFEDVTAASGLEALEFASCALFADFDGDGRVDLFVGSSEQRLWRNDGKGVFTTLPSGIEHDLVDLEAHALDHDRDGGLDLVLHTEAGQRRDGHLDGWIQLQRALSELQLLRPPHSWSLRLAANQGVSGSVMSSPRADRAGNLAHVAGDTSA